MLAMHPDAEKLLSEFPAIETVEALITDCNGAARGKWLPADKLDDLLSNGIKLPKSAVAQDIWGRDVPQSPWIMAISMAGAGLYPVPWAP